MESPARREIFAGLFYCGVKKGNILKKKDKISALYL